MIRKLQGLLILLIIPVGGLFIYAERNDTTIREILYQTDPVMHIGDYPVFVDIADTPELRAQGLSGREGLGTLNGMLFVFDEPEYHGIWMKDMRFPIDVIWISEDLEVVGITRNLSPNSYPQVFEPPEKIRYLVETDTRYADTLGIGVGDKVVIPNKYLR